MERSSSIELKELLVRLLEPFDAERFSLSGPFVTIADSTASMFGLAVHELATNAIKYGALSVASGRVSIAWRQESGVARAIWEEKGGPPVNVPLKKGFGSKLFSAVFKDGNGSVEVSFQPTGLTCIMNVPTSQIPPGNNQPMDTPSKEIPKPE